MSNVVRSRSTIKTVLKGDPEHRNVKARLSDDPHPDPPVDGAWTIHAEDGVVVVPEKLLAWEAARQAAHQKAASDERR